MLRKDTHKIRSAYRGSAETSVTAGLGTPYADPRLTVIMTEGYAPNGLDIVTNVGVAVGINTNGFLVPADGTIAPIGIIAHALLGTACLYEDVEIGNFNTVPSLTNGRLTNTETLHQLIPTVYQKNVLFDHGYSYKKDGASKALFELNAGDLLRPIAKEEIVKAITDETLPLLFKGETTSSCEKSKAMYAGILVKFGASVDSITPATANDIKMMCARVAGKINPALYNNGIYKDSFAFDYDLQGPKTNGLARHIFDMVGPKYEDVNYEKQIIQYYGTL